MNRKTGYYWIKIYQSSDWSIGFYNKNKETWSIIGSDKLTFKPFLAESNLIEKLNISKKSDEIYKKLSELELGDSLNKFNLVNNIWGKRDEFVVRSFDALYCKIKLKFPDKEFKSVRGEIIRTK